MRSTTQVWDEALPADAVRDLGAGACGDAIAPQCPAMTTHAITWGTTVQTTTHWVINRWDRVTWTMDPTERHAHSIVGTLLSCPDGVACIDDGFNSSLLRPGETFTHTFASVGTFAFFSPYGAGTVYGSVTVRDALQFPEVLTAQPACATCTVRYRGNATPFVMAVTPTSGTRGTQLHIMGVGFDVDMLEVQIGGEPCVIIPEATNHTSIGCTLGAVAAGTHGIYVTSGGIGTALAPQAWDLHGRPHRQRFLQFTAELSISAMSIDRGSHQGGTDVVLTGTGFGGGDQSASETRRRRRTVVDSAWGGWDLGDVHEDTAVGSAVYGSFCGAVCDSTVHSYTALACRTTRLWDVAVVETLADDGAELLVPTRFIASQWIDDGARVLFDGDYTDVYRGSWAGGVFGDAHKSAYPTLWRFFAAPTRLHRVGEVALQGRVNASTWVTVSTVTATVVGGWNVVHIASSTRVASNEFRVVGASGVIVELQLTGFMIANNRTCLATVAVREPPTHPSLGPIRTSQHVAWQHSSSALAFSYALDATPTITSVAPRFGTALGGTMLTIQGQSLGSVCAAYTHVNGTARADAASCMDVAVNDIPCVVVDVSNVQIRCRTGPRGGIDAIRPASLSVHTAQGFAFVPDIPLFRYPHERDLYAVD